MDKILFLIKFGEKQYMERLADGYFYFSYALKFRELEEKLKQKGQGDYLEGGSKIYATNMKIYENANNQLIRTEQNVNSTLHYEPADNIPVFCLFSCFENDCLETEKDTYKIVLPDNIKSDLKSHFDKADTAAIITNPIQFVEDTHSAFNYKSKAENVNYFHLEGIEIKAGIKVQDLQYFMYLSQDTPPVKNGKGKEYSFNVDYIYRALFCKDVFFKNEQEYRILLPDQKINEPEEFHVPLRTPIQLYNIIDVFNGIEIKK